MVTPNRPIVKGIYAANDSNLGPSPFGREVGVRENPKMPVIHATAKVRPLPALGERDWGEGKPENAGHPRDSRKVASATATAEDRPLPVCLFRRFLPVWVPR